MFRSVTLTPDTVQAADSLEFVIALEAGDNIPDQAFRLVFDLPTMVGSTRPSNLHNEENGAIGVRCSNPHVGWQARVWNVERGHFMTKEDYATRGNSTATMPCRYVAVDFDGGLRPGDRVEFLWGERTRGIGPGTKISHVVSKPDFEQYIDLRVFRDPTKGLPDRGREYEGIPRPVPDHETRLILRVDPRPTSQLRVFRNVRGTQLVPQDHFYNPTYDSRPEDLVEVATTADWQANENGGWVAKDHQLALRSKGLPLLESPPMREVFEGKSIFWGDLHTHSHWSLDCLEREKLPMMPTDMMRYARDVTGLDFYAVSDHHITWQTSRSWLREGDWTDTLAAVAAFNREGNFIVFPAIEFGCNRGDTNVIFNYEPAFTEIDRREAWGDIRDIWRDLIAAGRDFITIPHFHNSGRLGEGVWWACPDHRFEPILEITSCHGSYARQFPVEDARRLCKSYRDDRSLKSFLARGLRYGVGGNSDGHKGNPGCNGVTAVYAKHLDRNALFTAYRQRQTYASTNARLRLLFTANGALMGSELPETRDQLLHIDVWAEGPLKKIDVYRNGELYRRYAGDGLRFQEDLTVSEDGPSNWYVRVAQFDNQVATSSPIWFG